MVKKREKRVALVAGKEKKKKKSIIEKMSQMLKHHIWIYTNRKALVPLDKQPVLPVHILARWEPRETV